jgi:hypothetical protein
MDATRHREPAEDEAVPVPGTQSENDIGHHKSTRPICRVRQLPALSDALAKRLNAIVAIANKPNDLRSANDLAFVTAAISVSQSPCVASISCQNDRPSCK